jgi:UDP-N-acetylmuramate dehydrogenase
VSSHLAPDAEATRMNIRKPKGYITIFGSPCNTIFKQGGGITCSKEFSWLYQMIRACTQGLSRCNRIANMICLFAAVNLDGHKYIKFVLSKKVVNYNRTGNYVQQVLRSNSVREWFEVSNSTMLNYQLLELLDGIVLKLDEPLARYTAARLGGNADALVTVDSATMLNQVVQIAWQEGWPTRILGGGANVLIGDKGYRGLVIINDAKDIDIHEDGTVIAESGAVLTRIARLTMLKGISGFEWSVSVPGTLGGAIVNNAGAHGSDMATTLISAEIAFPGGKIETWPVESLDYHYRESALKRRNELFVVLSGTLKLTPGHNPAELQAKADQFIAHRKRTQPPGASLGSMFKNPPGDYAGRLIEAAGLKGKQIGGVIISPVHGNFFVNTGNGTASDYRELIQLAQKTVQEKFGVSLELEVELIGE